MILRYSMWKKNPMRFNWKNSHTENLWWVSITELCSFFSLQMETIFQHDGSSGVLNKNYEREATSELIIQHFRVVGIIVQHHCCQVIYFLCTFDVTKKKNEEWKKGRQLLQEKNQGTHLKSNLRVRYHNRYTHFKVSCGKIKEILPLFILHVFLI